MSSGMVAEIKLATEEALAKVKCEYYQLAAAIMRELGHPHIAHEIDHYQFALANKVRNARKEAGDPDLATPFVKGVRRDAELLRKAEREARIDECRRLQHQIKHHVRGFSELDEIIADRIRELEQAGGGTDDANRTEG